ncbi:uncharacterized protein EI97DRAFT_391669 [Westerdykella ornata]|uniref:Uncharacterized protein n=1 Tax=Westerdykella ornata TaxID=318751 RepID=A0A6A6JVS5_WESOR|nr:uncharacterized protein EI97DRAFT_391669 [Westerdykella ornata]KAF2280497.1 hypothetical protein EI97DRAFT_391669 [Westerdykella ornata]
MAGLLGGGNTNKKSGNCGGGLLGGVLNTVNDTTKNIPVVGDVTDPLLQTVGGVTDELPIVGSGGQASGKQAQQQLTPEQAAALQKERKKRAIALKKQQLALEAEEMGLDDE